MTELKKLLKGAFGPLFTDKMVERTFKEIDTDGSGSLDFAEVLFVSADEIFIMMCVPRSLQYSPPPPLSKYHYS